MYICTYCGAGMCAQMFLGLYHERCWSTNTIYLSQPRHVADLLSSMTQAIAGLCPAQMDHKTVLTATTEAEKCEHPDLSRYIAIVGSLMYIGSC
jgi:hypothetical protein